jgi:uncharacterized surface protein with fasciclin (FAS1) repeats
MIKTRTLLSASLLAVATAFTAVPATAQDDMADLPNIVEVAAEAGTFETLLAAADAAQMVQFFSNSGPMTVFAPTDDAFAALPEGTLDELLADPEALREVLMYHVNMSRITSDDIRNQQITTLYMMNFENLPVDTLQAPVRVGPAEVVTADIEASNGIIHVIDTVLVP